VVTEHERRDMDDSTSYHPVVTFIDHLNVRHHFTSTAGYSQPMPLVGIKVQVRYLLSDPDVAFIDTFFHMWAAPIGATALSAGAFLVWVKVWAVAPRGVAVRVVRHTNPALRRRAERRRLTLRSSGPAPASRLGREALAVYHAPRGQGASPAQSAQLKR